MGVYEGRGQLAKSLKRLNFQWLEAKGNWNDAQSRAFEEKYLEPLHLDLRNTVGAMDQMATLLNQIRRDCT